jgi:HEAT repeats
MTQETNSSTSLQDYIVPDDRLSGTSTAPRSWMALAEVVLGAAMWAMNNLFDDPFRPISTTNAMSSSAVTGVNQIILSRVRDLFDRGAVEFFEDGMESQFSHSLLSMLRQDGAGTVRAIAEYLATGNPKVDVTSEALRSLADFDDRETLNARWQILKRALRHPSPAVRDGAILGFANLNDEGAVPVLESARSVEQISEIRKLIDQVIAQLKRSK